MRKKIYQGSSKVLYQSEEDFTLIMAFTDNIKLEDGRAFEISGKGVINNKISSCIMNKLDMIGIENHLIEKINMREQLIQYVDIFPIQLHISTVACGRYVKEFGMEEGYVFDSPIIDFKIQNRELKHPIINEHQIMGFCWLAKEELEELKNRALRIYDFLTGLFAGLGIRLVECRLEFGRVLQDEEFIIMLADEISLDNCRLWDMSTNEKLSFEAIEIDPDNAIKVYQAVLQRFNNLLV